LQLDGWKEVMHTWLGERLRLPDDVLVVAAKRKQYSDDVRLEK
jgi:hypothetical protein